MYERRWWCVVEGSACGGATSKTGFDRIAYDTSV